MTNTALYIRSRQPLYMQAAGQIRLKIDNGQWRPGEQIPVIEVLQAEFGLSRATIREALDVLEGEGLIERYRGRGTFVRANLPERRSHALPTTWSDLVAGLRSVKPEMIAPISTEDGARLRDLQVGQAHGSYARFQRVHSRGREPYCLIDIYLREDVFAADADRFQASPVILVLAERHGSLIAAARQRVTFSIADERTASALGIALGAPVVEILRTICDAEDRVVVHTHARYPGEYVRLDFDFNTGGSARSASAPTER
ncbi:GntR family transcriptional regulator [Nitratireductor sp. ZSWI3]|uniref:GntR family transcriptional regulator n=1 Tax=Nitratireductor sp. ZSWI3 TaxID=2966359 RepID=UPI0021501AFD|nr:GntR family transcriptional regulator [Nitratireductor sp. ZSWI3]MCR4266685.1 GntR family transcriptional regulator [Nitratireductor sp. ZSWI3]